MTNKTNPTSQLRILCTEHKIARDRYNQSHARVLLLQQQLAEAEKEREVRFEETKIAAKQVLACAEGLGGFDKALGSVTVLTDLVIQAEDDYAERTRDD